MNLRNKSYTMIKLRCNISKLTNKQSQKRFQDRPNKAISGAIHQHYLSETVGQYLIPYSIMAFLQPIRTQSKGLKTRLKRKIIFFGRFSIPTESKMNYQRLCFYKVVRKDFHKWAHCII